MIAVLEEIRSDDAFGKYEFPIGEQGGCGDDFGRQLRERGYMRGSHFCVLGLSGHSIERLQCTPARRQCGIEIHCTQERVDGPGGVAHRDIAMPAFLEQPAEVGVKALEPFKGGERLGDFFQAALADCNHIQDVAVFRNRDRQAFTCTQRGAELIALKKFADAQDFRFDDGCGWTRYGGCLHSFQGKGGPMPAFDSTASDPKRVAANQ